MRKRTQLAFGLLLTIAGASAWSPADAQGTPRPRMVRDPAYGLTSDQHLVVFPLRKPEKAADVGGFTGFSGDTKLVGLDFRVQDRLLYGVGEAGGIYRIDLETAALTKVSQLTVALSGMAFGVDFNPAADRLRIVSNTGQNLRHNVNAMGTTIADQALTFTTPPTTPVVAAGIVAAAYTNNDLMAATATTLFDIDSMSDQIVVQSPPNAGILAATGKLGVDVGLATGFDVYSRTAGGVTVTNQGYACASIAGASTFYNADLLTGRLVAVGAFPLDVTDIAIPTDAPPGS